MPKPSKPHQQIYRPGSGPLRKSNHGLEETESDTSIVVRQSQAKNVNIKLKSEGLTPRSNDVLEVANKLGDVSIKDCENKKRTKKPEQQLYVPRVMVQAQAKEVNENHIQVHNSGDKCDRNNSAQINGSGSYYNLSERHGAPGRSKRYSNRRRNDNVETHDEWRAKSPGIGRNMRQGSEPRIMSNNSHNSNWNRMRDTKSVEPNIVPTRNNDKIFSKPPSGRRHSTIGLEEKRHKMQHFDTLPPRFKRKFLEENKISISQLSNEDVWDGSSVTFQGSHVHHSPKQHVMPKQNYQTYNTIPEGFQQPISNMTPNSGVYFTLPHRPRGRGRFQEFEHQPGPQRSMTPDKTYLSPSNSRPSTPTHMYKTKSNENLNRYETRSQQSQFRHVNDQKHNQISQNSMVHKNQNSMNKEYPKGNNNNARSFRKSLEDQLSPISPETPPKEKEVNINPSANTILVSLCYICL